MTSFFKGLLPIGHTKKKSLHPPSEKPATLPFQSSINNSIPSTLPLGDIYAFSNNVAEKGGPRPLSESEKELLREQIKKLVPEMDLALMNNEGTNPVFVHPQHPGVVFKYMTEPVQNEDDWQRNGTIANELRILQIFQSKSRYTSPFIIELVHCINAFIPSKRTNQKHQKLHSQLCFPRFDSSFHDFIFIMADKSPAENPDNWREYVLRQTWVVFQILVALQVCHGEFQVDPAVIPLCAGKMIRPFSVLHRDIKPDNILLGDGRHPFHAVLTDFGVSKLIVYDENDPLLARKGVIPYASVFRPPEILHSLHLELENDTKIHLPMYNKRADVWACGMTYLLGVFHTSVPSRTRQRWQQDVLAWRQERAERDRLTVDDPERKKKLYPEHQAPETQLFSSVPLVYRQVPYLSPQEKREYSWIIFPDPDMTEAFVETWTEPYDRTHAYSSSTRDVISLNDGGGGESSWSIHEHNRSLILSGFQNAFGTDPAQSTRFCKWIRTMMHLDPIQRATAKQCVAQLADILFYWLSEEMELRKAFATSEFGPEAVDAVLRESSLSRKNQGA